MWFGRKILTLLCRCCLLPIIVIIFLKSAKPWTGSKMLYYDELFKWADGIRNFAFGTLYDKISDYLKAQGLCEKYAKEDENIFSYLRPKLKTAIKNAQRLEEKFKDDPPSNSDPCTMVHHLFDEDAFGQYIL